MATHPFSIRLEPVLKARLEAEAARTERSAGFVIQKAVDEYLDAKEYKREAIREAVLEADKGVFISEKAMDAWVEAWGTQRELPMPEPDVFLAKA